MKKQDEPINDYVQLEWIPNESFIVTSYKGKKLEWEGELFRRAGYDPARFDIFKEINSYLASASKEVNSFLWGSYERIHEIIYTESRMRRAIIEIRRELKDFGKIFDYEAMRKHLLLHEKVRIPTTFERAFNKPQSINSREGIVSTNAKQTSTREKTYLYEDYVELISFAAYVRLLTPIWGSFTDQYIADLNANFKEHVAGQLIYTSAEIVDGQAYQKLLTYTTSITDKAEKKKHVVMDGLPQVDFASYVFNLTLIRRVTIGDIRGNSVSQSGIETHLVTYIHSFLDNRIRNNPDSFTLSKLRDKDASGGRNQDEESKMTNFESVRISEEFSPGSVRQLQFYFTLHDVMRREISPTTPKLLIEQAMENAMRLDNQIIHPPQNNILGWLLGPYYAPKAIFNLEKKRLLEYLGFAQATLWHHGLHDLAIILSLTEYNSRTERTLQSTARSNIPASMIEEARKLFPHHRRASGRIPTTKPEPIPVTMVKNTVNQLLEKDWRINLHEAWDIPEASRAHFNPRTKEYRIPSDIRVQLMELVLRIGKDPVPFKLAPETSVTK